MDYGKILSRALKITWKHKALWLFGFLAALFGGGGGNFCTSLNYQFDQTDLERFSRRQPELVMLPKMADDLSNILPVLLIVFLPLLFLLIIVAIIVFHLAQAALIGMVEKVEMEGETNIKQGFKIGWSRWLPLFGISVVTGLVIFFYLLLVAVVSFLPAILAFVNKGETLGLILLAAGIFLFLVLLFIFLIPVTIVIEFAFRHSVISRQGVFASLVQGYRLFRANLGGSLIFWLLMFVVEMAIGIAFSLVAVFFIVPVVLSGFVSLWLAVLLAIPVFSIFFFLSGLVQVFVSAAWTLAWQELFGQAAGAPAALETADYPIS